MFNHARATEVLVTENNKTSEPKQLSQHNYPPLFNSVLFVYYVIKCEYMSIFTTHMYLCVHMNQYGKPGLPQCLMHFVKEKHLNCEEAMPW